MTEEWANFEGDGLFEVGTYSLFFLNRVATCKRWALGEALWLSVGSFFQRSQREQHM